MTKAQNASFKLIDGAAAIEKAIASIASRGKRLDKDIWIAAVSAMAHHDKHGDVTLVNRLVDSMPRGSRVNALRDFIMAHGKVAYDEDNKCFKHDREGTFDLAGATAKCWTEYKPEPDYVPYDAMAGIMAVIRKVEKASADKPVVMPEGLADDLARLKAKYAEAVDH